ncbi:uncharacterized protein K489DRAFT_108334 [Dissoconium aciculare CBS 342.82]|uniref:Epidermal growth factor receptor-like transmembrane-juxtamembrane segment domain-containing protein n=1 Tax=Dissoconium aciculare CBS 342.82 TaxID=1314786 RepID=A0A6J3MDQ3_9PEZI|nr:uncharacterized protein K489DRAFT_108334 [Dissoconium aciculare CBS 342.82]KAF1826146.1 hypothetical protein K489DRAFT_108334 [Dissoconium aciculare CBS 342.82]
MSQLSMSCPTGGTFYACNSGTRFVGCCASNPCGSNGCPAGNLKPASFPAAQYGSMTDQQCEAGEFYTCAATSPPFWGCCKTNPCNAGSCGSTFLSAAFLSNNPASAAPYLALYGNTNAGGVASSASSSSASTSDAPTSSASSNSNGSAGPSSNNAGAIAGGIVGGLAVLAILILGIIILLRRRKQNTSHENENLVTNPRTSDQDLRPYKDNSPNLNKSAPHAHQYYPYTPYGANYPSPSPPPMYGFSQAPPQPPANIAYELADREVSELHGETYRGKPSRSI